MKRLRSVSPCLCGSTGFSKKRFLSLGLFVVALLSANSARAHSAPGSAVALDFRSSSIDAELRLPLSELEISFGAPLAAEPALVLARHRAALFAYVLKHIAAQAPDGRAWQIVATDARVALEEHPIDLDMQLRLTPPAGAPLRQFTLTYDVISHEVMNHFALISVRRDWRRGIFADDPEAVALLRSYLKTTALDRLGGSLWPGLGGELDRQWHRLPAGVAPLAVLVSLVAGGFLFRRREHAARRPRKFLSAPSPVPLETSA